MKRALILAMILLAIGLGLVFLNWDPATREQSRTAHSVTLPGALPPFEAEVPLPQKGQNNPIVFKWQDKYGTWHYGDSPPPDSEAQVLRVEPLGPALAEPAPASASERAAPRS